MAQSYHIVFEGKLTGEVGAAETKKQLAVMFKMNTAQVEALFTGKPVVIKRDVDEATAAKFKAAFKKAGAVCRAVPAEQASATTAKQSSSATAPAQPAAGDNATGRMAGKDIVKKQVPQDLDHLTVGQAGENIPTQTQNVDVQIPDVSGLSFSTDENYLTPEKETPEPDVDISGLSFNEND